MLVYNIITEDINGVEYNDEVYTTIKFSFNLWDYFQSVGPFPDRRLKEFTVKVEKTEEK